MKNSLFLAPIALVCIQITLETLSASTLGTLSSDTQIPLVVEGKTVGSMTLKAGTSVNIVQVLPDGVMISKGEGAPVKIAKEALTTESLATATATPTPVTVSPSTPTASRPSLVADSAQTKPQEKSANHEANPGPNKLPASPNATEVNEALGMPLFLVKQILRKKKRRT